MKGDVHFCQKCTSPFTVCSQFLAVFLEPVQDSLPFCSVQRNRTIIIFIRRGRNGTGNDICLIIHDQCTVLESKGLLKDNGVFICRIGISSEAEVAKTVGDIFSFVFFDPLEYVRMMAYDQICALIYGIVSKLLLYCIGNMLFFESPVKINDDKLCAGFL